MNTSWWTSQISISRNTYLVCILNVYKGIPLKSSGIEDAKSVEKLKESSPGTNDILNRNKLPAILKMTHPKSIKKYESIAIRKIPPKISGWKFLKMFLATKPYNHHQHHKRGICSKWLSPWCSPYCWTWSLSWSLWNWWTVSPEFLKID